MHKLNIPKKEVDIEALTDIHTKIVELFKKTEVVIKNPTKKEIAELRTMENKISNLIREYFDEHVQKLQTENDYQGSVFVDAISIIELSVSKVREIRKILS